MLLHVLTCHIQGLQGNFLILVADKELGQLGYEVANHIIPHAHIIPQQDARITTCVKYSFPPMVNPACYKEDWD